MPGPHALARSSCARADPVSAAKRGGRSMLGRRPAAAHAQAPSRRSWVAHLCLPRSAHARRRLSAIQVWMTRSGAQTSKRQIAASGWQCPPRNRCGAAPKQPGPAGPEGAASHLAIMAKRSPAASVTDAPTRRTTKQMAHVRGQTGMVLEHVPLARPQRARWTPLKRPCTRSWAIGRLSLPMLSDLSGSGVSCRTGGGDEF